MYTHTHMHTQKVWSCMLQWVTVSLMSSGSLLCACVSHNLGHVCTYLYLFARKSIRNVVSVAELTFSLQVVEFHPDSTIIETTKTPEQLNLQPRDISIFATNKLGVQAQRATITPRNGAVLFRTEIAKAIIYKDRAVLFHSRSAVIFASNITLVLMTLVLMLVSSSHIIIYHVL